MWFWLFTLAWATEPGVVVPEVHAPMEASVSLEIVVPWSQVGLLPAAPESPVIGPDLFALGPDGAIAFHDRVGKRFVVLGDGAFAVDRLDDLRFTPEGTLLVLDDSGRTLFSHARNGAVLGTLRLPGIVPSGGMLDIRDDVVCSVDVFGACHPIASLAATGELREPTGDRLLEPQRVVRRVGDSVLVDQRIVTTIAGQGGARLEGQWLLVEQVSGGFVQRRAVSLAGGAEVEFPLDQRLYAPTRDVACADDGTLGWMDPREDGLHIVTVTP